MQSSNKTLRSAISSCVREEIQSIRERYSEREISLIVDNAKCNDAGNKPIRSTNIPQQYDDYVLTGTVPLRDDANLRRITVEVDRMEQEFSSRFEYKHFLMVCNGIPVAIVGNVCRISHEMEKDK